MRNLALLLIILPLLASAKIYHYIENGVDYFSDTPRQHAREVSIGHVQTFNSSNEKQINTEFNQLVKPAKRKQDSNHYRSISFNTPENDQAIWNQAQIPVTVTTTPELKQGDLIQLVINGKEEPPQASNQFVLSGLPRGSYSIKAIILDSQKNRLLESSAINFHVKRTINRRATS